MFKLCGILFIFLAAAGSGIFYNKALRREYDAICGLTALTEEIRRGISCYNLPLSEIYASFSHPLLNETGFTASLREGDLSAALSRYGKTLGLQGRLYVSLSDFAAGLGKSPAADQVRRCETMLSGLNAALAETGKLLPGRTRSVSALSLGCGMMAVILLL